MTDLTYDAPHRTPAQILADDITRQAASIRRGWPHMLPDTAPAQRMGRTSASALILRKGDDDTTTEDDLDPHTLLMHRRRNAVEVLNSWCRAVMDDRNITNPATLPLGNDAPGMCAFLERHADWIGWQDYAPDCRDELAEIAKQVGAYSDPWRREYHRVGACPFVVEDKFCNGTVRVQIGADESEAQCSACEQVAPIEWWEEVMGVVVHVEAVRATALAAILADRLKVSVTERTIRNWCRDGRLTPLTAFGPQPNPEGKPSYWFDVRLAVEEVALMDRPCSLCGRLWSGRGAVCGRCYATVASARPAYTDREDGQWVAVGQVAQRVESVQACSLVERSRCSYSDLPKAWCACAKCAR